MKHILLRKKWIFLGIILVAVLAFCAWIYGWGGGDINVIPFDANDVERIELNGIFRGPSRSALITERDEIQGVIDSINTFQRSGSDLKNIFKYGIGLGGTSLYEIGIYPLDGERFILTTPKNIVSLIISPLA